ncbi:MAG: DUF4258 domain-containing protein [Chloroflexi bacterium]|nr:DUF4258 domain-containing protein [Chloroflexota bacterium]
MTPQEKQITIQQIASQNLLDPEGIKVLWSRHSIRELAQEGWDRGSVERGLQNCTFIEDYPTIRRPLPDCLVLSYLTEDKPFHAVIAIDEYNQRIFIVTVYKPLPEDWHNEWQLRKK